MKKFTVGQPVWRYLPGTSPIEGVVTKVTDWGVYVRDYISEHAHSVHSIFERPKDWQILCAKLEDDAQHLEWAARKFAENKPEGIE